MFSLFENLLAPLEMCRPWLSSGDFDALSLTGLAARSKPKEGAWIQFVVIAAFIGFSVIKTFLRAKSAASEQKSEQSDSSPKPRPVPKRYASDGGYKTIQQIRDEKRAQIRAAFGIPTPPGERKLVSTPPAPPQPVKQIEKPVQRAKIARLSTDFASMPQEVYAEAMPSKISAKQVSKQLRVSAPSQTDSDDTHKLLFSSPQDLRTAILYYEILGKPVSLRDAV